MQQTSINTSQPRHNSDLLVSRGLPPDRRGRRAHHAGSAADYGHTTNLPDIMLTSPSGYSLAFRATDGIRFRMDPNGSLYFAIERGERNFSSSLVPWHPSEGASPTLSQSGYTSRVYRPIEVSDLGHPPCRRPYGVVVLPCEESRWNTADGTHR